MTKISIIIPIYNVEKYLSACLDSIINQTYKNLEIILVNDGSTDACPQICDEYAAKDNRIKVVHKKNGGLSDARNAGYPLVTGEYISFVDSDDLLSLEFYEKLLNIALSYNADIVECDFIKFSNENTLQASPGVPSIKEYSTEKAIELLLKEELKQVVWNKLYKTSVVNDLLFEKGKIHEDEYWTYKVFGNAKKINQISIPLYFYRQQSQSIMAEKYSIKRLSGLEAREERLYFIEKKFPKLTPIAVKRFWHSAFFNYQAITRNAELDKGYRYRKEILMKVKKNVPKRIYSQWKKKDVFWLKFFITMPNFCCKIRNAIKIGV